ncbi:MAG: LLM class flavin-dependent oxidoreductase [Acetobacteraceae bacterium]
MKTRSDDASLRVGLFHPNANVHFGSKLSVERNPDLCDPATHTSLAAACEAAGFDYLFMADSWQAYGEEAGRIGWRDPYLFSPIVAGVIAAATQRIGIITTIHSSLFHPVQIARMGGTLDALSRGRWGLNVVTSTSSAAGLIDNDFAQLDHDARYDAAHEAMDVLRALWAGRPIDHRGRYFTVKGQVVGPHAVQRPMPLIVSAGASPAGRRFAARHADYIFMPGRTPRETVVATMDDINTMAAEDGRHVRLQVHVSVLVRETDAEAERVSAELKAGVHLPAVAEYIRFISNLSTTYEDIYARYSENDLRQVGLVSGGMQAHGGPDAVAAALIALYRDRGVRGVALTFPLFHPSEIALFARLVLPRLAEAGIWVHPAERDWCW